jgi:hypothetical protein
MIRTRYVAIPLVSIGILGVAWACSNITSYAGSKGWAQGATVHVYVVSTFSSKTGDISKEV